MQSAVQNVVDLQWLTGIVFRAPVTVKGIPILANGRVIDGVFNVGTFC